MSSTSTLTPSFTPPNLNSLTFLKEFSRGHDQGNWRTAISSLMNFKDGEMLGDNLMLYSHDQFFVIWKIIEKNSNSLFSFHNQEFTVLTLYIANSLYTWTTATLFSLTSVNSLLPLSFRRQTVCLWLLKSTFCSLGS